jgi:hypothetical protein
MRSPFVRWRRRRDMIPSFRLEVYHLICSFLLSHTPLATRPHPFVLPRDRASGRCPMTDMTCLRVPCRAPGSSQRRQQGILHLFAVQGLREPVGSQGQDRCNDEVSMTTGDRNHNTNPGAFGEVWSVSGDDIIALLVFF